jgi:hypothetical protein
MTTLFHSRLRIDSSHSVSQVTRLHGQYKLLEEEKGRGYFSGDVRDRPRGRSVESRPKVAAIVACQLAVPKGCCRFTQVRWAVSA